MKKFSKIWNVIFTIFFVLVLFRMFGVSLSDETDSVISSYFEYLSIILEWMTRTGIFPILFVLMWFTVSFIISKKSGWSILKDKFGLSRSENFARNIKLKLGSGNINGVSFANCLRVGANEYGVLLKMLFLFRFGHPPLFIPWSAIKEISTKENNENTGLLSAFKNFMAGKYYNIMLNEFPDFNFKILQGTYEASSVPKYYNLLVKN